MVIVSACQAISTAKGLAEGAEDGVRDTLCGSVCIGPYGDEYQGSANLLENDEFCLFVPHPIPIFYFYFFFQERSLDKYTCPTFLQSWLNICI